MDNKISNVIGVPIPQWLIEQFNVRSIKGSPYGTRSSYGKRDTEEVKFLANKTAWVRLVSSINIKGDDLQYFSKYASSENLPFDFSLIEGRLSAGKIKDQSTLAENFILFSGTSKYQKEKNNYSTTLRSGISEGSYGMLGEEEINRYGYMPMPGITSVTVETMGRMGSIKSATINFKVLNKLQLDLVDALYFKLGYTMLLEWGHTYYYETPSNQISFRGNVFDVVSQINQYELKSTEDLMIDPFADDMTKEKINYQIALNVKKSYGNYDGMLGVVTNFNFSRKEDGSYDCTIKIIGLGAIAESLKINRSNVFASVLEEEIKKLVEVENVKIQNRINELNKENNAKIQELKDQINEIKKQEASKKTINEIYKEKIEKQNAGLTSNRKELSNYFYLPDGPEKNLYSENADIVYDPDGEWAIKKFGVIINKNVPIKSITLETRIIKSIPKLSSKENFSKNEGYTAGTPLSSYFDDLFSVHAFTAYTTNQYRYFDFEYGKENNGLVFIKDKLTANQIASNQLTKIKYPANKSFTIILDETNPKIFGISTNPLPEQVRKLAEKLYREKVYEELTNNPTFDSVSFSLFEVKLSSITESEVKKARYTNKLNANDETRYLPVLLMEKIITLDGDDEPAKFQVMITDSAFIRNIVLEDPSSQTSKEFFEKNQATQNEKNKLQSDIDARNQQIKAIEESNQKLDVKKVQSDEALKFQSSIENALRVIQVYSYNRARDTVSVQKINFDSSIIRSIYKSVGLYSTVDDFDSKIISGSIPDIPNYGNLTLQNRSDQELLEFYMKYGFNVSIMANVHCTLTDSDPLKNVKPVDHKDLLVSYVIPYQVSREFSQGISLEKPVYVKLGTLLMLINHLALMYDSKDEAKDTKKRPIFYVDYNPETNLCLTSLNHLSTNPFNFMIPYSGKKEDYEKLFDKAVLEQIKKSKEDFFDPQNTEDYNIYSPSLPEFLTGPKDKDVYRGKLMNVLIDIDYLLSVIKNYSDSDNTNSIYFKSFVDKLLSDMCKALGNYNLLRLAYNDAANCFYIVDDQIVPPLPGEEAADKKTTNSERYELPLYGNTSIAKNIEIKTDISSRLSNMIAISANSEKYQGDMGTDSTPFGYVNKNFTDRYVPLRTDIVTQKQKDEDSKVTNGDIDTAIKFNNAVIQYYGVINVSSDNVNGATNYYMSRMSKVKAENSASRASAIIPVSLNFTTDGVSGFNMYQSFGVNEELLPYTYTAANKLGTKTVQRQVGFCVVGLSHTIQENQWNTSVKSNMIFLKDSEDYIGEKSKNTPGSGKGKVINSEQSSIIEDGVKTYTGENIVYPGEVRKTKSYSEFIKIPGVTQKVEEIANYLGVKPSDIYIIIGAETAGTFDSTIVNRQSGATGLIQFMPSTARGLGTTTEQLRNMSPVEQLEYVKRYYAPYRGRTKNVYDLYAVTFFPAALGKSDSYVFQTKNISAQTISQQNPAIANAAGKTRGTPLNLADFKIYVSKKIKQFTNIS